MKYFLLLLFFELFFQVTAHAQVDPLYAQYLNNPVLINPATTGMRNDFSAALSYRKQWAGFDGQPETVNFNSQLSVAQNKVGLGFIILQDNIGNNRNTEAYTTYSYNLSLPGGATFSFGLQAGLIDYRSSNDQLNIYDINDPAFNTSSRITRPSFGAGIAYRSDRMFIGLAVPRMLKQENSYEEVVTNLYSQHVYLNAAYVFFLSERLRMKPSVLMKGVTGSPLSVDYNLFFNFDEKYTAAVFTRNLNTYGWLCQLRIAGDYTLGYTFEIPTNRSVGTQYTTHELCLGINLSILSFHETSIKSF